jgi:hypothetical protein
MRKTFVSNRGATRFLSMKSAAGTLASGRPWADNRAMKCLARALPIVLAVLCSSTAVRAQESASPERPSAIVPLLGGVVAAGGMYMTYRAAVRESDGDPDCATFGGGCTWMGIGGGALAQVGGAGIAYWAWKQGEADAREDRAAGRTKDVSSYKVGGLVVGGLGLAAFYGAAIYAGVGAFDCGRSQSSRSDVDYACLSRAKHTPTLVQLGATGALLLAVPFAGYGLGYEAAAGERRALILPTVIDGRGGLALVGRF